MFIQLFIVISHNNIKCFELNVISFRKNCQNGTEKQLHYLFVIEKWSVLDSYTLYQLKKEEFALVFSRQRKNICGLRFVGQLIWG